MFLHPFTALVAGPTGSGKSELLHRIVLHAERLICPPPKRIVWCYAEPQSAPVSLTSRIPHLELTGNLRSLDELESGAATLIILDDWMSDISKNKVVSNLFYRGSHHRNLSVFLLIQNLFHRGPVMRDVHLNTQYLVLFKNPRDSIQVRTLSRQIFPHQPQYLIEAYADATREPYGYLVIDLKPSTRDDRRLKSRILPNDNQWVYLPKGI